MHKVGLLVLGIAVVGIGCSMSRFAFTPCTTNQQCRDAFGWGHVCTESLCATVQRSPRCPETWPPDLYQRQDDFQDAIVIGMQFDRSAFELEMNAARLAVMQAMNNEGLDGQSFALVECTNEESSLYDDLSQEEANIEVSVYLADEVGVSAMIGPATSDRVDAAFLAIEPFGTMLMTPTATSPSLTELDGLTSTYEDPGLLWRTAPPDDLQGRALAQVMDEQGYKTAAVVNEKGPYGTGLTIVFDEAFAELGGQTQQLSFASLDSSARDSQIDTAASRSDDAVLFISGEKNDILVFLNAVGTDDRFDDKQIFLADGGHDLSLFEDAALSDADLERIQGTVPGTADPDGNAYKSFVAEFTSQYGRSPEETGYTPYAYDAAWLVLYGTAWSYYQEGRISGLGTARGLRRISTGPAIEILPSKWNLVRAHFQSGDSIDVVGASGELDYDSSTGETSSPIEVWTVRRDEDSGELVFEPVDYISN